MIKKAHKYKAIRCVMDGFKFDSKAEMQYYIHLKFLKHTGKIKDFSLQPEFVLQDKFKHNSKMIRAIKYIADFTVIYIDNSEVVIDIKGKATQKALVFRKLFLKKFPEKKLKWIKLDKKMGWSDYFK